LAWNRTDLLRGLIGSNDLMGTFLENHGYAVGDVINQYRLQTDLILQFFVLPLSLCDVTDITLHQPCLVDEIYVRIDMPP
jgi:hypothetical protein